MRPFRIAIALLISAALLSGCGEKAPAVESNLKTAAGHTFALWHLPDTNTISISVGCPDDWLSDPSHNPAVRLIGAQLLLAGGAEGIEPADLQEKFKSLQAEGYIVATFATDVRGSLVFPLDKADEVVALANRVLTRPALDQEWLSRIKGEFTTSVTEAQTQPSNRMLRAVAFAITKDPLRAQFANSATPSNVKAVTREEVAAWHKAIFTGQGLSVAIAGNIDAERAGTLVDALLQGLPDRRVQQPTLPPLIVKNSRILVRGKPGSTTTLAVSYLAAGIHSPADELRLLTGLNIMAGDTNALLFKTLREKLQATYGFNFSLERLGNDYLITFFGEVEPQKVMAVHDELTRTFALMGEKVQPKETVDHWTGLLAQATTDNLKNAGGQSPTLLNLLMNRQDVQDGERMSQILANVTSEDLRQTFSSSFPHTVGMLTVVASPDVAALPGACIIDDPDQAKDCP